MCSLYLGIDTSNYTTSVAAYCGGRVVQCKRLLPVKKGELGLRQSDAVFHHTVQLPELLEELSKQVDLSGAACVGASFMPRSASGSYMPCFTVGSGFARSFCAVTGSKLYRFSHQQGHIAAAIYSSGQHSLFNEKHLAFHVSGGTTEALIVTPDSENIINAEIVGKTLDLNAGQLVDRVGVMLGLQFPCGKGLEQLAINFSGNLRCKPTIKGCDCCLSGVQNICEKLYKNGTPPEELAAYVLKHIEETLYKMAVNIFKEYGKMPVLFSGGVMSNSIIKESLTHRLGAYFAQPQFSADNAAGVAVLAAIKDGEEIK